MKTDASNKFSSAQTGATLATSNKKTVHAKLRFMMPNMLLTRSLPSEETILILGKLAFKYHDLLQNFASSHKLPTPPKGNQFPS